MGGAHWHHLANMTEPSMCGGDAAFLSITLTTCLFCVELLVLKSRQTNDIQPIKKLVQLIIRSSVLDQLEEKLLVGRQEEHPVCKKLSAGVSEVQMICMWSS